MQIRQLLIASALALPLALPVAAKPPEGHQHGEKLIQALQLDEARASEVREIMASHHEERQALRKEMREKRKAMYEAHQEDLATVLTEEEMNQLKAMHKEMLQKHHGKHKSEHGERHHGGHGGHGNH